MHPIPTRLRMSNTSIIYTNKPPIKSKGVWTRTSACYVDLVGRANIQEPSHRDASSSTYLLITSNSVFPVYILISLTCRNPPATWRRASDVFPMCQSQEKD